jgi:hypothetical protein
LVSRLRVGAGGEAEGANATKYTGIPEGLIPPAKSALGSTGFWSDSCDQIIKRLAKMRVRKIVC